MIAIDEIFLVTAPGLEDVLADEARALGLNVTGTIPGGVTVEGGWPAVWRANVKLRGAVRVLARIASFRAMHLAQLDKRARKIAWDQLLRADVPVKVEAVTVKSKIYHAGAAAQRVETAIRETLGAPIAQDAPITIKVRIEDDLVTISVDTTGESLHKRGHKQAVNKAPMRETLAALFLRQCGYHGQMPVLDPMCGSGTLVIEAAEVAMDLPAGRARSFAFEQLAEFDRAALAGLKAGGRRTDLRFYGSDRDAGAIRMSRDNAARAGVGEVTTFETKSISDITPPEGPAGLVIINPPYGARIGEKKTLFGLYGAMGKVLSERFKGWQVGIITSDSGLAKATGLPFLPSGTVVANGGLKVQLFRTDPL
ncbi:putative N6-adenine-specific DNA methylase [Ketogulonicigenium robustum]|uniref:Putative N6-adenine-specific DNA methylase n=1 Tax=Ketogulonicigenium robustum TaxID=92947 RepID=A0A1W6P120_9RHOB|nr:RNA methyltransferase [Ketogulonicigenium robustum]ARO15020.1 putative N6-adenine-specific DNA methylase [Ketogulonicigenium robustum]